MYKRFSIVIATCVTLAGCTGNPLVDTLAGGVGGYAVGRAASDNPDHARRGAWFGAGLGLGSSFSNRSQQQVYPSNGLNPYQQYQGNQPQCPFGSNWDGRGCLRRY